MERKQLYQEITSLNLQDEVKRKYGKNYTQCTNVQLKEVLDNIKKHYHICQCTATRKDTNPFDTLVDILAKKNILLKSEVEQIKNS